MNITKGFIFLIISILSTNKIVSQYNQFYIGIGVYDFDNITNTAYSVFDPIIGCDEKYLQSLLDFNFNLILPYHQLMKNPTKWVVNSPSKDFLDRANSLGIKVILNCPEISIWKKNLMPIFDSVLSEMALNYYGSHPAVIGWHIVDEPSKNPHFSTIKQYADAIEIYDPTKLRFSNLYPNYASNKQLQYHYDHDGVNCSVAEYEDYLNSFMAQTNPNFLSVDHYLEPSGTNLYFYNLDIVAKKANEYDVPYFVMFAPLFDNRPCTTPEFNYTIFANLVYGAKGLFYWAREGQSGCGNGYGPECSGNSYIAPNFWDNMVSNATKNYLKDLHKKILEVGNTLFTLKLKSVYHVSSKTGFPDSQAEQTLPTTSLWSNFNSDVLANDIFDINSPIVALNGSKIDNIVISFLTDNSENKFFWIFNKSVFDDEYIQLNFNQSIELLNILDKKLYSSTQNRIVYLKPGEAKLFRVNNDDLPICDFEYISGNYPDIWAENILIGGLNCDVRYYSGSKVNYYGSTINLKGKIRAFEGSDVSFKSLPIEYGLPMYVMADEKLLDLDIVKIADQTVNVYPNPSKGQVTISTLKSGDNFYSIALFDLFGRKKQEFKDLNNNFLSFHLNCEPGVYILKIKRDVGFNVIKLFIN
ncbi:MAG: T9SS type A sorting domain-containing protein [Saprospiraceae bacterium]|nr:T9SS type A sorting domain-containing protein [Saprospiraceae bacterium]